MGGALPAPEGLSNREIGDRLSVTRDGIKYHVTQILLKLGVSTREEAAAWDPAAPVEVAPAHGLAARLSGISRLGLIGAAGVLLPVVAALAGAVAYNEIAGGGSSTDPADVSAGGPPTASPGPYGVPTPTPVAAVLSDAGDGALGQVAYVKDGNLWMLNLDTGEDRMIVQRDVATTFGTTAKDLAAFDPEWSVDGQWIAFGIKNSAIGYTTIWVVRPGDGRLESRVGGTAWEWSPTTDASRANAEVPQPIQSSYNESGQLLTSFGQGEPKWSPDGRSYVRPDALGPRLDPQHSDAGSAPYMLRLIDTEAASGPTLTPTENQPGVTTIFKADSGDGLPVIHSWSPDGKYILFWPGPGAAATANLDVLSVDNPGDVRTVAEAPVNMSGAAWSPDGSLLAVVQPKGDAPNTVINVIRPDGTPVADIGSGLSLEPAWSPDGSRLSFSQDGHISTSAATGGPASQLTSDASYSDRYPQWSRDGSRIVFVRLSADAVARGVAGPAELWLMNSDGSDQHKVGDLPAIDLAAQSKGGFVDWTQYLSWYRPSDATVQTPTATPYVAPTPVPPEG